MPHIVLECTDNVELDVNSFFKELTEKLVATGNAPKLGMKCRVVKSAQYYIIDGSVDYKMANLLFKLREGRSRAVLENFSQIGIQLLEKYFQKDIAAKKIIISTEIKELIKGLDLTKNAVR
jgi:5-carboxymethyl-2-hydroxymuconate isomerase